MWEEMNFPFLDFSFLQTPEFQQQIQDAIAQYEQPSLLPVENIVSSYEPQPSLLPVETEIPAYQMQPLLPIEYAAPIYQEPTFVPLLPVEQAQMPVSIPEVVNAPIIAEPMAASPEPVINDKIDAGGPEMAITTSPVTTSNASSLLSEILADRRIAANTPPSGTTVVGPSVGEKPLAFGEGNTFNVGEGQEVRIVGPSGNVIYSGSGVQGANDVVAVAQNISDELGNNANYKIQTGERTINPDGSVGATRYVDVARANPQQSGLGFLADTVLPFAASFIPGVGPVLGAALGSTASSVAQGRDIGETLLRAGITAATAGAAKGLVPSTPVPGSDAAINQSINSAINFAGQNAAQGAAQTVGQAISSAAGSTAGSTAGGLIDEIIVNALQKSAPSVAGSALGTAATSLLPNVFDGAQLSNVAPAEAQPEPAQAAYTPPPEEIIATAIRQPASTAVSDIFPAVTGGISNTLLDQVINQPAQAAQTQQQAQQEYTAPPEEIVVTAQQPDVSTLFPAATSGISNTLLDQIINQPSTAPQEFTQPPEEIVVTAQGQTPIPVVPPIIPDVAPLEKFTPTEEILKGVATGPEQKSLLDRLTSNMGLTDYLTLASLVGSAFGGGGGGGSATAVPYVSPFGAGAGFGTGRDYRVSPGITDYERYGFGPEASFFAPEYSQLVSGAAGAPMQTTTGPQASTINPKYVPLI